MKEEPRIQVACKVIYLQMNIGIWVLLASSFNEFGHEIVVFFAPYTALLQPEIQFVFE